MRDCGSIIRKGKNLPLKVTILVLVLWFRFVCLPEPRAWFWVLWIQVKKNLLPLRMKAKGGMLIFPCCWAQGDFPGWVSSENLSLPGYCVWRLNDSNSFVYSPGSRSPCSVFQSESTSCLTLKILFCFTTWLLQVLLQDVKAHKQAETLPGMISSIIALRNFLKHQKTPDGWS